MPGHGGSTPFAGALSPMPEASVSASSGHIGHEQHHSTDKAGSDSGDEPSRKEIELAKAVAEAKRTNSDKGLTSAQVAEKRAEVGTERGARDRARAPACVMHAACTPRRAPSAGAAAAQSPRIRVRAGRRPRTLCAFARLGVLSRSGAALARP
jgi:hypothetical protein